MTDILVIGSVNLDLSASVSRLPAPGETITGATLGRFPGGKGANQALAARRLGANVKLIACVGDDATADEALALVRAGGVDLEHCMVDANEPTGVALISVTPSGENHIVVAPGANARLTLDNVDMPEADALICQLEVPGATIASAASTFAGFFCVNLAPARDIDKSIIERADLVVVNETESAWYGERLSLCNGMVATTYGKAGAELSLNGKNIARTDALLVNAIDATGAGDVFTAALTVALVEQMNPADALRFACTAASVATTIRGAQPSLPSRKEIDARL
ncbi:MAG: ribokinase [Gammaproteobacteria bacterium]|nr:ribokinase [Gammaproteobacteria bacterium]